jgi:hypothetical protein
MFKDTYPHLVTWAAAAYSSDIAALKAFDELESTMLSWTKNRSKSITIEEIDTPHDHGVYYAFKDSHKNIDWLYWNQNFIQSLEDKSFSFQDLINKYSPVEVVLKEPKITWEDFWVVRILSEKLVPLNFGYWNEPTDHLRFKEIGREMRWSYPAPPHFFT